MALFKKSTLESFIKAGKLEKIKKQLTPANYNNPDAEGHAPLYYAIKFEKSKIARYLLEQGSTPATGSSSPDTPVMEDILRTFNKNLLTLFLEFGENLPDRIEKLPLLHYVVTHKYFYKDLLKILTDTSVDINLIDADKTEKTALAYLLAQEDFSLNALTALLEAGADVNYALSNEFRPLHVALTNRGLPCKAKIGNFSFETVLDSLIPYGLEVNFRVKLFTGSTVSLAKIALQNQRIESFLLLLEKGMDIESDDLPQIEGYLDVNKFSIHQRKRIIAVNKERNLNLPLHTSFYGDELESVLADIPEGDTKQLSSKLTDLVMTTHRSLSHKIPLFEELLKKGADINAEEGYAGIKMNVLTALTSWNDGINDLEKLIGWLLDHGAKIECHGRSAFLWAVWFNKPNLVRLYAEKGADLLYREVDGSTMLSKIFTDSPSHNQFVKAHEMADMIKLLHELCTQRHVPFPVDEPFLHGDDAYNLTESDILPLVIFRYYKGETRRILLDVLLSSAWDINRKFKSYDPNGSILTQLLLIKNIEEETIVHLLDNYPEMDLSPSGTEDPLRWAIFKTFSPETIKRFINKAQNINKQFIRNIDGDMIKTITTSYMDLVLSMGSDLEAETWVNEVGKALLEAGHDPNSVTRVELTSQYRGGGRYRKERTLLESTVMKEDVNYFDTFKLLLDYGADPYRTMCYFEESFLHFLTQRAANSLSDKERIQYMEELDKRDLLQLESKNNNGGTALLYAASKCRTEMVRYLVEKGADINAVGGFDQSFALHRAISNWNWVSKEDRLETVRILLDSGADLEQIDNDGYSPLMAAAAFGCYTVTEELLSRGANPNIPNQEGMTSVHFAVKEPYGYDTYPDDSDSYKENAMDESLKRKIIKLLAEHGANLNLSHKEGATPVIDAIGYAYPNILKELIKLGADVTQPDCYGRTPLMVTAKYGPIGYINILGMKRELENSFHHQDDNGENVLHYLASRVDRGSDGSTSTREREACTFTQMLTEKFAIPYQKNNQGQTPLHYAAINGMLSLAEHFLGKEANINEIDNNGSSALMYAVSFDEETVAIENAMATVKLLIENGADVNIENEKGQTAMGISMERKWDRVMELLKKAGAKDQTGIGFV